MTGNNEPIYMNQLDAHGNIEKIDVTEYPVIITCKIVGCRNIRYVKSQDRSQVIYCKPHTRMHRLSKRATHAKDVRANKYAGGETLERIRDKIRAELDGALKDVDEALKITNGTTKK